MNNKVDSMLGLAAKAYKLSSGEYQCECAIKNHEAKLIILSSDASLNTTKKFNNMSQTYNTKLVVYSTKEQLGHIIGKDIRSVVCVKDDNFARNIIDILERKGGN